MRGKPGDKLANAIKANVAIGVERLKGLDPILAPLVKTGDVKVVGAIYKLRTGVQCSNCSTEEATGPSPKFLRQASCRLVSHGVLSLERFGRTWY